MAYTRRCPGCGAMLRWTPREGAGSSIVPGHWEGHEPECREPIVHPSGIAPDQTFNPENVVGPDGQPTWVVVCSFHRLGAAEVGQHYTETVHVRASSYDGAILLARELFPERMIDADAQRITERMA